MKLNKRPVILPVIYTIVVLIFHFIFHVQSLFPNNGLSPKHQLEIDARLVPMYALDSSGKPVYDLSPEEIELQFNGTPMELLFFNRFGVPGGQGTSTPQRLNFVIIDSTVTSQSTMEQIRAIARGIMTQSSPGDSFTILESNPIDGLRYITGPEKNKTYLYEAMTYMVKRSSPDNFQTKMKQPDPSNYAQTKTGVDNKYYLDREMYRNLENDPHSKFEMMEFHRDIPAFSNSIRQLKRALKTINGPRTVFLISAPREFPFNGQDPMYYRFLEDTARQINYGGALFYLISPQLPKQARHTSALSVLNNAAGGTFITGTSVDNILKKIKFCTSAYYELAFNPGKEVQKQSMISLHCKRNGVRLFTVNYCEKAEPYRQMDDAQKKLFALNIVNKGNWSRMAGRVGKLRYRIMPGGTIIIGKNKSQTTKKNIYIYFPPEMRNKTVDFFLVEVEPATQKAKIDFITKAIGDTEQIALEVKKSKEHYFVYIDPAQPLCGYNRVRL